MTIVRPGRDYIPTVTVRTDIDRLKEVIEVQEHHLNQIYAEIGKAYVSEHEYDLNDAMAEKVFEASAIETRLEDYRDLLEEKEEEQEEKNQENKPNPYEPTNPYAPKKSDTFYFCPHCGHQVPANCVYCTFCGAHIPEAIRNINANFPYSTDSTVN